jgi:hypothetical protein
MKRHARNLISKKQFSDPIRGVECDGCRKQILTLANISREHRFVKLTQRKPCVIATYLPIERRIAINKISDKSELAGKKIARRFDVRNEQLWGDRCENRTHGGLYSFIGHGVSSCSERLPSLETSR